jgi:hypothetical protein
MKQSKSNPGMVKGNARAAAATYDQGYEAHDYQDQRKVNANELSISEFLDPPEYQCDAVMVSILTSGFQKE